MRGPEGLRHNDAAEARVRRAQARISEMTEAAQALAQELRLPEEAQYDLLSLMYADSAVTVSSDRVPDRPSDVPVDRRTYAVRHARHPQRRSQVVRALIILALCGILFGLLYFLYLSPDGVIRIRLPGS
jgi:hypothetical protein